jgi:acetoin utilization protein AcuB
MYVKELMTPNVITISPQDTLAVARELLRAHRIHHLLVVENEEVVGVLSYRELIGKDDTTTIAHVMCRDVQTVQPWDTIRVAATRMIGRTQGCLPVLDAGKVQGILTTSDLLRAVSHTKSNTAQ